MNIRVVKILFVVVILIWTLNNLAQFITTLGG